MISWNVHARRPAGPVSQLGTPGVAPAPGAHAFASSILDGGFLVARCARMGPRVKGSTRDWPAQWTESTARTYLVIPVARPTDRG